MTATPRRTPASRTGRVRLTDARTRTGTTLEPCSDATTPGCAGSLNAILDRDADRRDPARPGPRPPRRRQLWNLAEIRLRWTWLLVVAVVVRFATEALLDAEIGIVEALRLPLLATAFACCSSASGSTAATRA